MKNIKTIIFILLAMTVGFSLAWFLKPTSNQSLEPASQSTNQPDNQAYTCSMHPQIRQNEPGICPICEMDLIPLEANSSDDPLVLEMTPEAVKLANIETTIIGATGTSNQQLFLSGKIQADERLAASQVAHIPGRIEQLFVTFTGEAIRKGQQLAILYSPELISAQQELLEALKIKDLNAGLLKAARKKLEYWKIPTEKIREIEESGQIQETFAIYADATGIVTDRRIAVGDYIKQGEVLFDILGLHRLWVLFDAYEENLASIKVGDQIAFTTPAIPNQNFTTRITFIDPMINPKTRVASIRGEINNRKNLLKPEMFVRGLLQSNINSAAQLMVPRSAVLWTGPRSVVYIKVPNTTIPSFKYKEVQLGERMGENYLIKSGLESGDEVVTYGNFTIDAAAQLNNQASMMNKNVVIKGMEEQAEQLVDYTESTPAAFKQQLANLSDAYLLLKDALVATDQKLASQKANKVLEALSIIDMSLLKGDAHQTWMEQFAAIEAHSKKIHTSSDVEQQRKQFDFLSQALIKSIKVFGVSEDTYYIQYCPMAFDDTGAEWISDAKEIRNPYFGDVMLKCGLVQETINEDYKIVQ